MYRRASGRIEIALGDQTDRLRRERTVRLPKGIVEEGESHAEAALREVREETGLAARVVAPLGTVAYSYQEAGVPIEKVVHFFLMECLPGKPADRDGELDDVRWRSIDEAARVLTFETEREVVARARLRLEESAR